ncbi:RidA family protein [Morganella morganii]|uniref:RidA family protein n=1 Tax=Morganella morganii TaxID=582 RepID=UPI00164AE557|nr:RidA family protein [Morganella morganii]MBC4010801.1 RidA family protein [Morganella morganii]
MTDVYTRLKTLNIELPPVVVPNAKFQPYVIFDNTITLSGHLSKTGEQLDTGKFGADLTIEQGEKIARQLAVNLLGTLQGAVGDLNKIKKIINLNCMINGTQDFTDPHVVANACSQVFHDVFGEKGYHSRNALTVAQLPFGACMEISLIAGIE